MKILLTGAGGQVGSEVAKLHDDEFRVAAFDRHALDITSSACIEHALAAAKPDMLVNCAAYTAVDRAEDEPQLAHRINADAVALLGRHCAARHIGVVHLSTDYVFDGRKAGAYTEDDAPAPLGTYGESKFAGEVALRAANDRHLILRVSWVFGHLGRSFVDTILRLAKERPALTVVDDQIGSPSPASSIAAAIRAMALAAASKNAWGTYHFATRPALSWCAFARRIVALGHELGIVPAVPAVRAIATSDWPTKAARPLNSQLDASKLETVFGIAPQAWEAPLRAYLRQLQAQAHRHPRGTDCSPCA